MKKLSKALLLSCAIILSATAIIYTSNNTAQTAQASQSTQPIGVIDTITIFQESVPGKAAVAYLSSLQDDAIARIKPLEEQLNAAREKGATEEAAEISVQMQSIVYELQETLKFQQEVIFGAISEELTTLIEKYRAEKNITVIFNKSELISSDPKADISEDIMAEFNKVSIDYEKVIADVLTSAEFEEVTE